jgi:hypothetical protein
MSRRLNKRVTTAALTMATLCLAGVLGMMVSVGPAGAASPATGSGGFTKYKNALDKNTKGWCTYAEGCNGQGGNESDYGTIDVLPESYSNSGGYAPGVPGPGKAKSYARVDGAGLDQDTIDGCPQPGYDGPLNTPYCEGPYVCYLGTCSASVFPSEGFTSSIKIYIDPNWAADNPGQYLEWDTGMNNTSGDYLNDNGFTMCTTTAGGGGFAVNLNQFGSCNPSSENLTAAGWYTLEQNFQSVGGQVYVTYTIVPPHGSSWTSAVDTGEATSGVGGPSYLWFADEDVLGLPVAQVSVHEN